MAKFKYSQLSTMLIINIACSYCYVNYEIFEGFDFNNNSLMEDIDDSIMFSKYNRTQGDSQQIESVNTFNISAISNETFSTEVNKKPVVKFKKIKEICPETEHPYSLGTYLVPTQRDLVLFTKRTLMKMFNSYHKKALLLLKDIKEVTRATHEYENKCKGRDKASYRTCVKRISKQSVAFTKDLITLVEDKKAAVSELMEGTTCNMTQMKTDPIQLIEILAMDDASLEFALPAFLRLIGSCSDLCSKDSNIWQSRRRPSRHMSDQDLVVKHLLTRKNYMQLIKDSDVHI